TQFNPTDLIKEIINSYQHKYNIKLEMENDIVVSFDRTHFYQIITNLVQNAIDATQETEEILIRVFFGDEAVIIQIIDNGSGISTENISRIFEPYYTNKKKGTGLGLALAKKLVDLNDAEIQVKSKIGQGSTFEIILKTV
nr:ATP-binding protein [Candidatus Cloacimonadota bacterium]